jgi:cell division protein FtsW (lipid II flippase)
MVDAADALGLALLVLVNSAAAALLTRFFRVRLQTRWGSLAYIAFAVPVALLVSTLVLGSVLGPDLGSAATVVGVSILLPFSLGVSFDYFWMPAPEEVDLPERRNARRN